MTTLTHSLGTFVIVSLVFSIAFAVTGAPVYLGFVFGGIDLRQLRLPSFYCQRISRQGSRNKHASSMAVPDDIVAIAVFFTINSLGAREVSGGSIALYIL